MSEVGAPNPNLNLTPEYLAQQGARSGAVMTWDDVWPMASHLSLPCHLSLCDCGRCPSVVGKGSVHVLLF